MRFNDLTKAGKIRTCVFLGAAVALWLVAVIFLLTFRDAQFENVLNDPTQHSEKYGFGFTLFFVKGMGLFNGIPMVVLLCIYGMMILIISAVVAVLIRLIVLNKVQHIRPEEFRICSTAYGVILILGIIVSLILTKGNMILTTMIYEMMPALFMYLLYILPLQKRSVVSGHGHFIQGTQQDLTNL